MGVKRYKAICDEEYEHPVHFVADPGSIFVLYSDYHALEQRNAELALIKLRDRD